MAISLDAVSVECGGTVAGTASWAGGGTAEITLHWTTSGDGIVDAGAAQTVRLASDGDRFSLAVPNDGPMTFTGKLISVRWAVTLQAGDTTESTDVAVLPRGGLTVWVRKTAPPPQV